MMKRFFIILAVLVAALLFASCQEEKVYVTNEENLGITVKLAGIDGRSMTWKAGDMVYFGDNASTRPGFQFTATEKDISSDGKVLKASYNKASVSADTLYAIHAQTGRIRLKKTEEISAVYDGTLSASAMPAGTALKGSELLLSPIVGVGEFSLRRGYVGKVRISASKSVFPKTLHYDFGGKLLTITKATDIIEVTTEGDGPFYIPFVPDVETVSFDLDFLDNEDRTLASGSFNGTINTAIGRLTDLGELDGNAVDIIDPSAEEFEKASQAVKNMGVGVNLSGGFEVLWKEYAAQADRSNPAFYERQNGYGLSTQTTMDSFASAGFKSVRIPITWWMHMDDVYTSTIDKVWLDRIEEVVNYCKNANLYCIINMHHDAHAHADQGGQWVFADMADYEHISQGFKNVWSQIAERFKDYDEFLLFEGYNEITDKSGTWTFPKNATDIAAANKLNQDFVNTVRKTGGKNATRNLVVSTYSCTVNDRPLNAFEMPSDLRPGHLIVQVHNYAPSSFCSFSSATEDTFGSEQNYADIQTAMNVIKRLIIDKGWPCIIGEYGAPMQRQAKEQQTDGSWRIKRDQEEVAKHAYYYTKEALKTGVCPMFWYIPQEGNHRTTGAWTYPKVKDALIQAWTDYNNQQ